MRGAWPVHATPALASALTCCCGNQVGVIPARYQSIRFPGKPLIDIGGKPMIVRTWEQAMKATELDAVIVATDSTAIAEACISAGAEVVMTSESCPNGGPRADMLIKAFLARFSSSEASTQCCKPPNAHRSLQGTDTARAACQAGTERCNEAVSKLKERFDIVIQHPRR